jgi:CRP-like cAMP-binding protein
LLGNVARKTTLHFSRGTTIYWHGDRADSVCLNLRGTVLLKVVSPSGREGVVDIITQGGLFGETCVFDDPYRTSCAITVEPTTILSFDKHDVRTMLRNSPVHSEEFMRHLILRNNRIQNQLQDQLFSSSELRLARILRLLASGRERTGERTLLPRISQSVLASIVGTTRSRICYFLIEFRKLGIVENLNGLRVDTEMIDAMLGK